MRMLDEITLRAKTTTQGASGYPVTTYNERDVYVDVMDVSRAEHYAAEAARTRADIVFVVATDEYEGQTEVEYEGNVYDVKRTDKWIGARRRTDPTRIELVCVRR